jgi:hypothetical protein
MSKLKQLICLIKGHEYRILEGYRVTREDVDCELRECARCKTLSLYIPLSLAIVTIARKLKLNQSLQDSLKTKSPFDTFH